MSIAKKLALKAEAAKGATGNTRLRTEGRVDQFEGNTKQAGGQAQRRL